MNNDEKRSDGLISEWDVVRVIEEMNTTRLQEDVVGLLAREPELMMVVTDRMSKIWPLIDGREFSFEQRQKLERQLQLLLWVPMVLLDRAHRRLWDKFLPDEGDAPT